MRKILCASIVTALLLTACAAQGKTTVTQETTVTQSVMSASEPTKFVLPALASPPPVKATVKKEPVKAAEVKKVSEKETPTAKAEPVEEVKESSVFLSLKKYMELHDLPSATASKYAKSIEKYAAEYDRDPYLVLAMIHVETGSTYKNNTEPNGHGAVGLMQILESNLKNGGSLWKGYTKQDLKNPDLNIKLGVSYLAYLQGRFGYEKGIIAYNQGEGNVSRGKYKTWYGKKVLTALDRIKKGKENRY